MDTEQVKKYWSTLIKVARASDEKRRCAFLGRIRVSIDKTLANGGIGHMQVNEIACELANAVLAPKPFE